MSEILKRLREECMAYVAENFGHARLDDEQAWNAAIQHVLGGSPGAGPPTVHDLTDEQLERVVEAFNELTLLAAGPLDEVAGDDGTDPAEGGTYSWLRLPSTNHDDLGRDEALDQFVAEAHRIVSYWLVNSPGGPWDPADQDGALS